MVSRRFRLGDLVGCLLLYRLALGLDDLPAWVCFVLFPGLSAMKSCLNVCIFCRTLVLTVCIPFVCWFFFRFEGAISVTIASLQNSTRCSSASWWRR